MYSISLRRLILWLCVLSVIAAAVNSLYVGYRVQRDVIIKGTLESNRAYAAKLADTTESVLSSVRSTLAYSAEVLGRDFGPEAQRAEAERIRWQANYFNSVAILDEDGTVTMSAPFNPELVGRELKDSAGAARALAARSPLVTDPYVSATGRWAVTISHPVFSAEGEYLGYVGGTIYLHEPNILHGLLGGQMHRDGSFVFVVDQTGTLLYHPNLTRIGDQVATRNKVVDRVLAGESGAEAAANSLGVDMLAGFAPIPQTNWGVVVQRSRASTLAPLDGLLWRAMRDSLPLLAVLLAAVWYMSALIARPLWRMASVALRMGSHGASDEIAGVRAWYFEAAQLRRALITGLASVHGVISTLREDSVKDPLTGLLNRRGLDSVMARLRQESALQFGVLIADIDHFKRVNDVYGHAMGDAVLSRFADLMRTNARDSDVLGRLGGEEFIMLLPGSSLAETVVVAERLRKAVQSSGMPHGETLTVSIGISHCHELAPSPEKAAEDADVALYEAKKAGRNRVQVANASAMARSPRAGIHW